MVLHVLASLLVIALGLNLLLNVRTGTFVEPSRFSEARWYIAFDCGRFRVDRAIH